MKWMLVSHIFALAMAAGCGAAPEPIPGPPGPAGLRGEPGQQGPQGLVGLQGPPGTIPILAWAYFNGFPPVQIITSGGPVGIVSFTSPSVGFYRIEFNVPTATVGIVIPLVTAFTSEVSGENIVDIGGVRQDVNASNLTLEVRTVTSITDANGVNLIDTDTGFALVVIDG